MKIVFDSGFPREFRKETRRAIRSCEWMLRGRVRKIVVGFGGTEASGSEASLSFLSEYHEASLVLNSGWAVLDPEDRAYTITHELSHTLTHDVFRFVHDMVQEFVPPDSKDFAWKQAEKHMERLTDDVAQVIFRDGGVRPSEEEGA